MFFILLFLAEQNTFTAKERHSDFRVNLMVQLTAEPTEKVITSPAGDFFPYFSQGYCCPVLLQRLHPKNPAFAMEMSVI